MAHVPEQFKEKIVQHLVDVHTDAINQAIEYTKKIKRYNYVTPKHYIDFINNYLKQLDDKHKFIVEQVSFFFMVKLIDLHLL